MPERLLSESEVAAGFRSAIQAHGLEPPEIIEPGTFQRFPGIDKGPSNRAGWCRLFPDGKGGAFGDHSSGLSKTWFVNSKSASPEQSAQAQRERKQAGIKGEEETSARHTQAAREAQERWEQGQSAPEGHRYLRLKRIKPHNLRATPNGALLVPVYDRDGRLSSVQTIFERDGAFQKRYHKGSATGGDHHSLIGGSSHYPVSYTHLTLPTKRIV